MSESLNKRSRDCPTLSSAKRRKTAHEASSEQHNLKLLSKRSETSSEQNLNLPGNATDGVQQNLKLPSNATDDKAYQEAKLARDFGKARQEVPQVVGVATENFLLQAQYLLAIAENEEEEEVKVIDREEFIKSVNRNRQLQSMHTLPSASASACRVQRMQQCHLPSPSASASASTSTRSRSRNGKSSDAMLKSFNKWLSSSWRKE